jgi:uncharacterized protein YoxC
MVREQREKTTGELRIELRKVREAVGQILDDYEQTAKTLDNVTSQVNGLEATDHADNVEALKSDLLNTLQTDTGTIDPPWERQGYATKQAWLNDK